MSNAPRTGVPSSDEILQLTRTAANDQYALAIAWHLVILLAAITLLRRRRLSSRYAEALLVVPALSVFMVSAAYYSWFNTLSFGLLAVMLTLFASDIEGPWRLRGPRWMLILGTALVAFGFCYPHFTAGAWYRSVYAAPIGLVPCPTLAVLAGFTLLTGAHGSRAIPAVLAVWTAFYAGYGIFKLGVVLDVGLLAGMIGLTVLAVKNRRPSSHTVAHAAA